MGPAPRSFNETLVPSLFVRRLENRCVLNGQAMPLAGSEVLVVIASNPGSTAPRDTVLLTRQADTVAAFVDGTLAATANFNDLQAIILVGTDKPDTFVIDFSGGNPIPYGGIQAFGGGNPVSAESTIVLQSCADRRGVRFARPYGDRVRHRFDANSSRRNRRGSINYSGINFVEDTVATQSATLINSLSGDSLVIGSPPGGDVVTVTAVESPTVAFSTAPGSLTVDTSARVDDPADAIGIQGVQSQAAMDLTVRSAATDVISLSGISDIDGGNLMIAGGAINIYGLFASHGGKATLDAGPQGTLQDYGAIDMSNPAPSAHGGEVELLGNNVGLFDKASVDASGDGGGGTVFIGGDSQGGNPGVRNAAFTYLGPDVSVTADAMTNGNGGRVVVWSEEATVVQGSLRRARRQPRRRRRSD